MAMDPRQVFTLATVVRDLYVAAEAEVLQVTARRLARGITTPGWADAKLAELGILRAELNRIVERLDVAGPEELAALLEQAHRTGARAAAGVIGQPIAIATNRAAVLAFADAASLQLRQTHLPILRTATDAYRAAVVEGTGFSVTGVTTRRQAAAKAMARFADRGVTGFVDTRGRHWDLASYTEMATRSALGQAHVAGHLEELVAHDYDLVRVSDSPDECRLCRPFEGRIFSISGRSKQYPPFSAARAGGLFHPNCTHSVAPWIPGLSRPFGKTADPIGAEERAQHRANEREIRHWKRREVVAEAMGDDVGTTQARAMVRDWQARQRDFIDASGRRRDYTRESITKAR